MEEHIPHYIYVYNAKHLTKAEAISRILVTRNNYCGDSAIVKSNLITILPKDPNAKFIGIPIHVVAMHDFKKKLFETFSSNPTMRILNFIDISKTAIDEHREMILKHFPSFVGYGSITLPEICANHLATMEKKEIGFIFE